MLGSARASSSHLVHLSLPQMYMQALLGPATAGWQMPLMQFTLEINSKGTENSALEHLYSKAIILSKRYLSNLGESDANTLPDGSKYPSLQLGILAKLKNAFQSASICVQDKCCHL